jgi:colanic acid/amylovoran biosynthesis glycosyltransferase
VSATTVRVAYLVSQYPTISHTFIMREVLRLRADGMEIWVASINAPDRENSRLTADERAEALSTYCVKGDGPGGALVAHLATIASRPVAYGRGLLAALSLAGTDVRRMAMHVLYFVEAVMIGRWMAGHGLSHLHVHFATPAATVGLIAVRIFPVTMSMTVHGPDEFYDVPGYILREKVLGCRFVCCISQYARSQLMRITPIDAWDRLEVVPLGVDPAAFSPRPANDEPKLFEVLCVGRLVPAKGQAVLIEAAAALIAAGRALRVRLVGDGPDRPALEALVRARGLAGHVIFEGAVDQDGIRALYRQADAFALASFAEGVPVVLMEAMAMEIPVIATGITGIPELIRDGVDGLLVMPSDVAALAAAIARLMDEPLLRRGLGLAGRLRVIDRYNLAVNVGRLAAVFARRLKTSPVHAPGRAAAPRPTEAGAA